MLKNKSRFGILECISIIVGMIIALSVYFILPKAIDQLSFFWQETECNSEVDNEIVISEGSSVCVQQFTPLFSNTKQLKIKIKTNGQYKSGSLLFVLSDAEDGKEIASVKRDTLYIDNDEEFILSVPKGEKLIQNHIYEIAITCNLAEEGCIVSVPISSNINMGNASIDGQQLEGALSFVQVGYNQGAQNKIPFFVMLVIISVMIILMLGRIYKEPNFTEIDKIDYLYLAVAMLSCCLVFYQGWDMDLTIEHAKDLMRVIRHGNIFHYYDTVILRSRIGQYSLISSSFATGMPSNMCNAAYNIWMYILLAIIILPYIIVTRLFHISYVCSDIAIYTSLILSCVVLFSAYLMYKIALLMNMEKKYAKMVAYIYASSSIILFGTIGFLQLDIIYVCVMQLAYMAYLKKKYTLFSAIMSFAIMLKVLPIMVFIPLILLAEKRIPYILKYGVIGILLTACDSLIFKNDFGRIYTMQIRDAVLPFKDRLFASGINSGVAFVAFFVVAYAIICLWCFDHDLKEDEYWKSIVVVPLLVYTAFVLFIAWHPQWFILIAPSIALVVGMRLKKRSILYCELGIGVLYCIQSAVSFPGSVDNYMVNNGLFKLITGHTYTGIQLVQALNNLTDDKAGVIVYSLLFALIVYFCIVGIKEVMKKKTVNELGQSEISRGLVYSRLIWMYLFCLLYAMMYFYLG